MRVTIHISRPKDKTPAKLKGILPEFVLPMTRCTCTLATLEIISSQRMQQIGDTQISNCIRLALLINQQWKGDPRFFLKNPRVIPVAQTDRRQPGALVYELRFVLAQLRDVLSAKDSSIMPQENN